MQAAMPPNEAARIRALRKYAILDTPEEPSFDRITRLAARVLGTPIATLTLVDEERQWFKSAYGLKERENKRELSFCAHAILSDDVMVVPDATAPGGIAIVRPLIEDVGSSTVTDPPVVAETRVELTGRASNTDSTKV